MSNIDRVTGCENGEAPVYRRARSVLAFCIKNASAPAFTES